MNVFTDIVNGLKWVGKEVAKVAEWVPRVVKLADDVEEDVPVLLPAAVTVFEDVEGLVLAAVKDGGQVLSSAQVLTAAIEAAWAAPDILNVGADEAVIAAFEGFVNELKTKSNWQDVLTALSKLTTDYDAFGAEAKAAIDKLETDAS